MEACSCGLYNKCAESICYSKYALSTSKFVKEFFEKVRVTARDEKRKVERRSGGERTRETTKM